MIAAYPGSHAIARVPWPRQHRNALIKQYLDVGVQTLLVPMVDTPEQAQALVRAIRYPPDGMRGVGGARSSRWGRFPNYAKEANAQVCLLVQVETREALANLDAIAATEGVDGVFIGPADLSAAARPRRRPMHPEVQAAIEDAIAPHQRGRQGRGHPHARRDAGSQVPRHRRYLRRRRPGYQPADEGNLAARLALQESGRGGSRPASRNY